MGTAVEMVKYAVTDAVIAEMRSQYIGLTVKSVDDAEGFKAAHSARMVVKGKRVEVEKKRIELKADALAYGRAVDSEARRITALLTPIEEHLEAQERVVTDELERRRRATEEAERAKQEAETKAIRDAEEGRIRAEREVEAKKLAEERERLASERAAMEAERAKVDAAQKAERDRLDAIAAKQRAETEKIAVGHRLLMEAEIARRHAAELEKAIAEAAARAKVEAEREAADAKLREEQAAREAEQERQRVEAMRPDVYKIHEFGKQLCAVESPDVKSEKAKKFLREIDDAISTLAERCGKFSGRGGE